MPLPAIQVTGKPLTAKELGKREPGCDKMVNYYKRSGASPQSLAVYVQVLGMVRRLADGPLLELTPEQVEELDERLISRASIHRTVLKMFYKSNRRSDLLEVFPRVRSNKRRKVGVDDVLMPADVMQLLAVAGSLRDRAVVAVLAATGGRVAEVLSLKLKDVRVTNGGYQCWFGKTKVRGQERFSPRIDGAWKDVLDAWLAVHPTRGKPDSWLFPSAKWKGHTTPLTRKSAETLLADLAKRADVTKPTNPHALRHARVTWGILNHEDIATLSIGIWGKPVSTMLNRYTHFLGREATVEQASMPALPEVPALPEQPLNIVNSQMKSELEKQREQISQLFNTVRKLATEQALADAEKKGK